MGFDLQTKKQDHDREGDAHKPSDDRVPGFMSDFGNPTVVYENAFATREMEAEEEVAGVEIEEVDVAVPEVKSKRPTVHVDPTRTPTTNEVLKGERPDLEDASDEVLSSSTTETVRLIFEALQGSLPELKATLSKTAPPPETPFALKVLGWAVEQVATMTLGYFGKLASENLFKDAPAEPVTAAPPAVAPLPKHDPHARKKAIKERSSAIRKARTNGPRVVQASEPPDAFEQQDTTHANAVKRGAVGAVAGLAPGAGKAVGKAMGASVTTPAPTQAPAADDVQHRAMPGGTLLDEFIKREELTLMAKQVNAMTMLQMLKVSAQRRGVTDLNGKLNALLSSGVLLGWFQRKVAMEWLNFATRAALGPREEGQQTDLRGANTFNGIADGGAGARQQWSANGAFVEITIRVPERVNGTQALAVTNASIPACIGATELVNSTEAQTDGAGARFNLATLPVYRRVHLQTGDSKLSSAPALIITPDGRVEADLSNPALAAIGGGIPVELGETTHVVGGVFTEEQKADENAWATRIVDATAARHGAYIVRDMLRTLKPSVIK